MPKDAAWDDCIAIKQGDPSAEMRKAACFFAGYPLKRFPWELIPRLCHAPFLLPIRPWVSIWESDRRRGIAHPVARAGGARTADDAGLLAASGAVSLGPGPAGAAHACTSLPHPRHAVFHRRHRRLRDRGSPSHRSLYLVRLRLPAAAATVRSPDPSSGAASTSRSRWPQSPRWLEFDGRPWLPWRLLRDSDGWAAW